MDGVINIPAPNPKQEMFFASRRKYTGYGGARGGGKSWAMRVKLVLLALRYPGLKLLLMRKTMPELRENHLIPLLGMLSGAARYNQQERAFTFDNGSRLRLGYCDHERDIYQYQGQEYDVIGLEECTHFTWEQARFLMTCNRGVREDFSPRMYFTGNPGGVGHAWFKRLFVRGEYLPGEDPAQYVFIPATIDDNEVLMRKDPDYVKVLDSLPEAMRRAHRFGDWDVYEGQVFAEFRGDINDDSDGINTHVVMDFVPPYHWRRYMSYDHGYSAPFSAGWWAVSPDGRVYRYREWYGSAGEPNKGLQMDIPRIAEGILAAEEEERKNGVTFDRICDPALFARTSGPSLAQQFSACGVHFRRGDNGRIAGKMRMHEYLRFDGDGRPRLYVTRRCRDFIRTLPLLIYSGTRPEDVDTDGEDHAYDEARYFLMTWTGPYTVPEPPIVYGRDDPFGRG